MPGDRNRTDAASGDQHDRRCGLGHPRRHPRAPGPLRLCRPGVPVLIKRDWRLKSPQLTVDPGRHRTGHPLRLSGQLTEAILDLAGGGAQRLIRGRPSGVAGDQVCHPLSLSALKEVFLEIGEEIQVGGRQRLRRRHVHAKPPVR